MRSARRRSAALQFDREARRPTSRPAQIGSARGCELDRSAPAKSASRRSSLLHVRAADAAGRAAVKANDSSSCCAEVAPLELAPRRSHSLEVGSPRRARVSRPRRARRSSVGAARDGVDERRAQIDSSTFDAVELAPVRSASAQVGALRGWRCAAGAPQVGAGEARRPRGWRRPGRPRRAAAPARSARSSTRFCTASGRIVASPSMRTRPSRCGCRSPSPTTSRSPRRRGHHAPAPPNRFADPAINHGGPAGMLVRSMDPSAGRRKRRCRRRCPRRSCAGSRARRRHARCSPSASACPPTPPTRDEVPITNGGRRAASKRRRRSSAIAPRAAPAAGAGAAPLRPATSWPRARAGPCARRCTRAQSTRRYSIRSMSSRRRSRRRGALARSMRGCPRGIGRTSNEYWPSARRHPP